MKFTRYIALFKLIRAADNLLIGIKQQYNMRDDIALYKVTVQQITDKVTHELV